METTTTTAVDVTEITGAIETVAEPFLETLTVGNIALVLAIVIAACLGLYLFYWGARKGIAMLKSTFESGSFYV